MGVLGLWSLLHTVHKPTSLESLEGKILAIDVSIWLNQALKSGNTSSNAHLHTLFFRLCKLLHFKIKPIFVFDGVAPELKKITLEKRRRQRFDADEKAKKSREQMLQNYLKRYVLKQQSSRGKSSSGSSSQTKKGSQEESTTSIFQLPDRDIESELLFPDGNNFDDKESFTQIAKDYLSNTDGNPDIESKSFKAMPLEVQHEIVQDLINTEKYKASYSSEPQDLPKESNHFSQFQLNRLLKRSNLQKRLDEIRQEISHRDTELVTREFVRGKSKSRITARRIVSQDAGHVILIKTYQEPRRKVEDVTTTTKIPSSPESLENDESVEEPVILESSQEDVELTETDMDTVKELSKRLLSTRDSTDQSIEEEYLDDADKRDSISQEDDGDDSHFQSPNLQEPPLNQSKLGESLHSIPVPERAEPNPGKIHSISSSESSEEDDDFIEVSPIPSPLLQPTQDVTPTKLGNGSEISQNSSNSVPPIETVVQSVDTEKEIRVAGSSISHATARKEEICDRQLLTFEKSGFDSEDIFQIATHPDRWADSMAAQSFALLKETHRQETMGTTVTERLVTEAQELLRLFGIPFVVSPQEAEAQCAHLDLQGLTDGSVTEDSDVWLFGARKVYKNFFNQNKSVEAYNSTDIEHVLGLSRSRMIGIAYLCGSDYCEGISSVGPVTAMEILAEFPADSALESIKKFKEWWKSAKVTSPKSILSKIREKLRKLELPDEFPESAAHGTYLHPIVEESEEMFTWGTPDLDLIREFGARKLGWSKCKVDDQLLPVLRKMSEKSQQSKITDFFQSPQKSCSNVEDKRFVDKAFQSKRLKRALTKMGQKHPDLINLGQDESDIDSTRGKKKRKQPQKTSSAKTKNSANKSSSTKRNTKVKPKGVGNAPGTSSTNHIVDEMNLSEDSSFCFSSDSDLDEFMKNIPTTDLT